MNDNNKDEHQVKDYNSMLLLCSKCKINIPLIRDIQIDNNNEIFITFECHCYSSSSTSTIQTINLNQYLEMLDDLNQTSQCAYHSNKQGINYCSLCHQTYCLQCTQNHSLTNPTHLLNNKLGNLILKCYNNTHLNHGIEYHCNTCNIVICSDCLKAKHFKHITIPIKDLRNKHPALSHHKSQMTSKAYYNLIIEEEGNRNKALINRIQLLIKDLQCIQLEIKEYINSLSINNAIVDLITVLDSTYYSTNAEYNMNIYQNMNKLKLKSSSLYVKNGNDINISLDAISNIILNIKTTKKFNAHCLFEIKQYVNNGFYTFHPLKQPTIVFSSTHMYNDPICIKEDTKSKYFQLKNGCFFAIKSNGTDLSIENIYTKSQTLIPLKLQVKFIVELDNLDIALISNYKMVLIDRKTLKQIESIEPKVSIVKAVELKANLIAFLNSLNDIYLWHYDVVDSNYAQVYRDLNRNAFDMIKFDKRKLAFTSGNSIKLFDIEDMVISESLIEEGRNDVRYLYKDSTDLLISSDNGSTTMWLFDNNNDKTFVNYPHVVTIRAIRLIDKERIALMNNGDVINIYNSMTQQMVLQVILSCNLEIYDMFVSNEGKIEFTCSRGIYKLN